MAAAGTGILAGALLPAGTMSGEPGKLLITFLGLVSASILPTISLILGSMTASGRSVLSLNELQVELRAAMENLFLLLALVAACVTCLIFLSIPTPATVLRLPEAGNYLAQFGQSALLASAGAVVSRFGQIPGILRRSLSIRHRIAVDEARRKTLDKAPTTDEVRASFATDPNFGRTIQLADIVPADDRRG